MDRRVDVPACEGVIDRRLKRTDRVGEQVLECCADHIECQVEYQRHDPDECGNRGIFSGQDPVDGSASRMLFALSGLHNRTFYQLFDKREAHIRDGCGAVKTPFLLHLDDDMFDHFFLVLREVECLLHVFVALDELSRRKTNRDSGCADVILDQMHDAVKAAVHRAAVIIFVTEIETSGPFLIMCHMDRVPDQFVDSFVFCGGDGDDRNAQDILHHIDTD